MLVMIQNPSEKHCPKMKAEVFLRYPEHIYYFYILLMTYEVLKVSPSDGCFQCPLAAGFNVKLCFYSHPVCPEASSRTNLQIA